MTILLAGALIIRHFPSVFGPPSSVSPSNPSSIPTQSEGGTPSAPAKATSTASAQTLACSETAGGAADKWTDPADAGRNEGPGVGAHTTIQVSCRRQGLPVPDGDQWWYRLASAPWSKAYYATADAFYNDGQTSGTLNGTPHFDARVPLC